MALLDGVPLVLAVVVAAVDEARHGVPVDAHFALHVLRVLLHQDVQQAHLGAIATAPKPVRKESIQTVESRTDLARRDTKGNKLTSEMKFKLHEAYLIGSPRPHFSVRDLGGDILSPALLALAIGQIRLEHLIEAGAHESPVAIVLLGGLLQLLVL